ncbi:DUF262 domain-containing protein [Fibrella aquatica]|uniref:DUF262 domain-containing protein n=1 Tax=Fibrella aquatica TaxID=3242487 RepID=UPI003521C8B0
MTTEIIKAKHIEGETFQITSDINKNIQRISDDEINDKYKRGEIRIVTEQARYPLVSIEGLLDSGKYDRNPEYQRRKRWDTIKKSRLIESFIMNVPIPPIFLYEAEFGSYEVMDGLQRLTSIYDFYKNKFRLDGLQYWDELNGRLYSELPNQVRAGIDRRYLSSIILLQETAKSKQEAEFLKQIVFERLNSGGELLTPQETRNALYNGKFNQLCIRLSKNDLFRKMWKMPLEKQGEEILLQNVSYRKMEDVELVLRFFAYRHLEGLKEYTVEKFLDEFLKQANLYSDTTLKGLEKLFNDTVDLLYSVFKERAFLLPTKKLRYKSPSKTTYDPIMQAFAMNLVHGDKIIQRANDIRELIYTDKDALSVEGNSEKHIFDGRYSDRRDVQARINFYNKFLSQFI